MFDVLVHIDDPNRFSALYALARKAVTKLEPRLRVLWIDNPPVVPNFVRAQMGDGVEAVQRQLAQEVRDKVQAAFVAEGGDAQWIAEKGVPGEVAARYGRCADLIVVPQPDWSGAAQDGEAHVGEELLFSTGRPVLFLPREDVTRCGGERIVVAWNDSPQAARAIHDSMPFLVQAKKVMLVGIEGGNTDEIVAHLTHRGVNVTLCSGIAEDDNPGLEILALCDQHQADMLVMGAYGHSRLREFVLGGATRYILKHQNLAVLMAH